MSYDSYDIDTLTLIEGVVKREGCAESERGRDRTGTGRGAEGNVLGLDRREEMTIRTALFLCSHRKTHYGVGETNRIV